MIGQDFEKIQWHFAGLELLEPNAMLGDIVLFAVAMYMAAFCSKIKNNFFGNWRNFYFIFGWSFLFGGFGHLFYNYLGLWGKYPSWILGMLATYFLTRAMIDLWENESKKKLFALLSKWLLAIGILSEIVVFIGIDLSEDQSKGLFVPTLISGIGLIFALVYLGVTYQRKIDSGFKFFWIAALTLLPNAFIQSQKINLAPWFDRNDFSHVLLLISLLLYFKGLRSVRQPIYSQK